MIYFCLVFSVCITCGISLIYLYINILYIKKSLTSSLLWDTGAQTNDFDFMWLLYLHTSFGEQNLDIENLVIIMRFDILRTKDPWVPLGRKEPFTSSFCEEWIRSTPQDRSQRYIFLGSNPSNPGYLKIDYYLKKKSVCIHEKSSNVYQIYLKWREFGFENKNSSRLPVILPFLVTCLISETCCILRWRCWRSSSLEGVD